MDATKPPTVRFGQFELDLQTAELRSNGNTTYLQEKPFLILTLLLERRGQLVTREELTKKLWPSGTFVDFDQSLNKAVNRLREALGDSAEQPRFIETLPRRGYRLIGSVETEGAVVAEDASLPTRTTGGSNVQGPSVATERPWHRWWPAFALSLILISAVALFSARHTQPANAVSALKQRQLTANSSENAVTSGAVSADGKFLAYSDVKGIHLKLIETGETKDIALPAIVKGSQVSWGIVNTWIRDGTAFVANATSHGQPPSVWLVSVTGRPMRRVRDDALAWTVSRDGQWVAFGANLGPLYYSELWMMRPDGSDARKVFDAGPNTSFGGAEWSPDGQRLAYVKLRQTADAGEMTIESRPLQDGPPATAITADHPGVLTDWSWSPDGRIIYSIADLDANTCNFWETRIDSRTGKPLGKSRQLTNWSGFCLSDPSFSADGKRLSFLRSSIQSSVYLTDIDAQEKGISTPVRLTLNEGRNDPIGWTADSKAVVFISNREGHPSIFKQSLGETVPNPIAMSLENDGNDEPRAGLQDVSLPVMSADSDWILYLIFPEDWGSSLPVQLMRIPVEGGTPRLVLTTTVGSVHSVRCARSPATLCAIAERTPDHKNLTFTAFEPLQGRGRELARFGVTATPDADYDWDLSPDATRIAILKRSEPTIYIKLFAGEPTLSITVKKWSSLQGVRWAADGKGFFVSAATEDGALLAHADSNGDAHLLWQTKGTIQPPSDLFHGGILTPWAVPSPDGRHLALCGWTANDNVWLLENF
jgi:DNA-binding winged helix-turn-helix (wHTH) protein/Tol biopolymer transport system component